VETKEGFIGFSGMIEWFTSSQDLCVPLKRIASMSFTSADFDSHTRHTLFKVTTLKRTEELNRLITSNSCSTWTLLVNQLYPACLENTFSA